MLKKTLLLFISIYLWTAITGQDAYVLLKDGTEFTGDFKITESFQEVFSKKNNSLRFWAENIQEFKMDGKVYNSVSIQPFGEPISVLAEHVYSCGVDVLRTKLMHGISGNPDYNRTYLFIRKEDQLYILDENNLETNYRVIFGEDFIQKKNQNYSFGLKSVLKVLKQNGLCLEPVYIKPPADPIVENFSPRLFYGMNHLSHLNSYSLNPGKELRGNAHQIGIGIRMNTRFNLNLGVDLAFQRHVVTTSTLYSVFDVPDVPIVYGLDKLLTQTILGYEFSVGKLKIQPGIGLQLGRYQEVIRKTEAKQIVFIGNGDLQNWVSSFSLTRMVYGFIANLEFNYPISNGFECFGVFGYQTNVTQNQNFFSIGPEYGTQGFAWQIGVAYLIPKRKK